MRILASLACGLAIGCGAGPAANDSPAGERDGGEADAAQQPDVTPVPDATPVSDATPDHAVDAASLDAGVPVPKHFPTWAYDEHYAQGADAGAAEVQRYVTYAEAGYGNPKAYEDCNTTPKSCRSVWYFDPNLVYGGCPAGTGPSGDAAAIAALPESAFVHLPGYQDASHRLVTGYSGYACSPAASYPGIPAGQTPVYRLNGTSQAVQSYYGQYLRKYADAWDYFFMDDVSASAVDEFGAGCANEVPEPPHGWCMTPNASQELPTDTSVAKSHASLAEALDHLSGAPMQFFTNGYSVAVDNESPRFPGGFVENEVINAGVAMPAHYATVLADELTALQTGKIFVEGPNTGLSTSPALAANRVITSALAWLAFDPDRPDLIVVWKDLEDETKNLAVWPEDLIVPTSPIQSMSASPGDLAVTSGVWRREFGVCYREGAPIGPCAAVVNSTSGAVVVAAAWLQQAYAHTIELVGGDILGGGTLGLASSAFTAGSTVVPAGGALLLVK